MSEAATPQMKILLPPWAKLLIGIFVASLVGIVISIIFAATTFANWQQKVRDPKEVQRIAASTFGIQQLPPKFAFAAGYKMPPALTLVVVSYDSDQTNFVIQQSDNTHGLTDPNLPEILQHDPIQPGTTLEKPTTGEGMIGGHKMSYMVGDLGASGKIKQFRAAFLSNNNKSVNRITGTTADAAYNMEATKQLLSCIK